MKQQTLIIHERDYQLLMSYIKNPGTAAFDRQNASKLKGELEKGKLMDEAHFPVNVVRLGSKVITLDKSTNKELNFTLVLPEQASIKEGKISIFAPIGTALLGYKKGQEVKWQMPSGEKTLFVKEVFNA